jgi:hypothetical protein
MSGNLKHRYELTKIPSVRPPTQSLGSRPAPVTHPAVPAVETPGPPWLNGMSPEEYAYQQAVERAMRPRPREPEPDPHDWVWN